MRRYVSHVVVGAIYHPPDADGMAMTSHILGCLDTVARDHPQAGVVLLGDFNRLKDTALLSYPLRQVVRSPTRENAILDKIYTNLQDWYERPVVLPNIGNSDHRAVFMEPSYRDKIAAKRGEEVTVVVRSQDSNGKALLAQAIENVNWRPLYAMQTCDEMVTHFYSTVTGLVDYYLPLLTVKRHTADKPWVTDQFRRLIRCRQNAWRNGEMVRFKALRNKIQRLARQLRRKFYARRMQGLRTSNPRNWWRTVKQLTGQQSRSSQPLSALANQLHDGDLSALASSVNVFFQQVAADLGPLSIDVPPPPPDFPSEFDISRAAVEAKLRNIDVYKAPGPDGLPNWILRDFSAQLAGPVCAIFNASVREGFVPTRWKEANVIPVPKVQPPRSIESDLRPISLTATLGKLLESFVGAWILQRIEDQLDGRQYGALKRRSTTHALVDMLHHWHSATDQGQSIRTVFIDFAKAFDHVDHNILVAKLLAFGLPDTIIRWMCDFLRGRRQRVKIGEFYSEWLEMVAGMPQGSFLGPLTFIVLIDSLRAACLTHKFVDDTTVTEILNRRATSQMQTIIDDLVEQATHTAMNVNGKKTKEMLVGTVSRDPPPPLMLGGATVDRVTTFKLLGVHVSDDLRWQQHVDAISSKAASRLWFLRQLKRSGAPIEDLLCFYKTVVRPVLEYACPVWHSSLTKGQTNALESLQKRAMRIVFGHGDYQAATIIADIDTLQTRRETLSAKFFIRNVLDNTSCLNYLLPERRDPEVISRFRHPRTYEITRTRTGHFQNSYIPYCLANYQ
jgi:hypothetical protein